MGVFEVYVTRPKSNTVYLKMYYTMICACYSICISMNYYLVISLNRFLVLQLSPEFVLQLKSLLTDEKDTSFTFMNEKYIIIRRDPTSFISRCLKKSILFHITPKR